MREGPKAGCGTRWVKKSGFLVSGEGPRRQPGDSTRLKRGVNKILHQSRIGMGNKKTPESRATQGFRVAICFGMVLLPPGLSVSTRHCHHLEHNALDAVAGRHLAYLFETFQRPQVLHLSCGELNMQFFALLCVHGNLQFVSPNLHASGSAFSFLTHGRSFLVVSRWCEKTTPILCTLFFRNQMHHDASAHAKKNLTPLFFGLPSTRSGACVFLNSVLCCFSSMESARIAIRKLKSERVLCSGAPRAPRKRCAAMKFCLFRSDQSAAVAATAIAAAVAEKVQV